MALKKITYLSLFPEVIENALSHSLISKAQASGRIQFSFVQIRDFAFDKHKSVDDTVYGGGAGMLLKVDVLHAAWKSVTGLNQKDSASPFHTVLLSPQGRIFQQDFAKEYVRSGKEHLILVCGHYEGVDERFIDLCVDEEWSIGDYVLTGGEFAALVMSDVLVRLLPGTVGNEDSLHRDSLEGGLLKWPEFTRPKEFLGLGVPDILLSGHHENITRWRNQQALERTRLKRPDLYEKFKKITSSQDPS